MIQSRAPPHEYHVLMFYRRLHITTLSIRRYKGVSHPVESVFIIQRVK